MIVTEHLTIDGRDYVRTVSDSNRYIISASGAEYEEAVDPAEFGRTYTEGREIPPEIIEEGAKDILGVLLGNT